MEYTAPPAHSGVGLTVLNDKTGPLSRIAAYASYAYHLPVGLKTSLSFGVSLGVQEVNVDVNRGRFRTGQSHRSRCPGKRVLNKLEPDVNAGLWLSNRRFFVGLSAQQIVPVPINSGNGTTHPTELHCSTGKLIPHTFLTAGYKIIASEEHHHSAFRHGQLCTTAARWCRREC